MNLSASPHHAHGLSHLMEAATTLAQLTGVAPPPNAADLQSPSQPPVVTMIPPQFSPIQTTTAAERRTTAPSASAGKSSIGNNNKIFPQRLMDILNDETLADTITWLPHGRSFVIVRPDVFTEQVLPRYLPSPNDNARGSSKPPKYPSFTRKLNRW